MAENENAGGYTVVQKWMAAELKLKGTELVLYSLIFNFTQTNGGFSGSLSYLQEWTNCTKQGLIKCLKSMEANNLIAKQEHFENGRRFVSYHTTKFTPVKLSLPDPVKLSLTPHETKFNDPLNLVEHPVKLSLPKNIDKNIDKKNIAESVCGLAVENSGQKTQPDTHTQGEGYKPPSLEEVAAYCREIQSTVSAQTFHSHYSGNGWTVNGIPLHDWRAKLRYWDAKDREQGKTTLPENVPGYTPPHNPLDEITFD